MCEPTEPRRRVPAERRRPGVNDCRRGRCGSLHNQPLPACSITYSRAASHARENVGRVAPAPGVSVHRAIASMSARIRSTLIAMCDHFPGFGRRHADDRFLRRTGLPCESRSTRCCRWNLSRSRHGRRKTDPSPANRACPPAARAAACTASAVRDVEIQHRRHRRVVRRRPGPS